MKEDFPFHLLLEIQAVDVPEGMLTRIRERIQDSTQMRVSVSTIRWAAAMLLVLFCLNLFALRHYHEKLESVAKTSLINDLVTENNLYYE